MQPEVAVAPESEADRVIDTILLAFTADPLARWFWPDPTSYLGAAPFLEAFGGASVEASTAWVTTDYSGAALWLPPGVEPDEDTMGTFVDETVPNDRKDDVFGVLEAMEHWHPEDTVWYLPLIGVDPAAQGRGIGSALLKAALARIDADGLPAYLESSNPRNVGLYERHGFEALTEIQVGSSPIVTPMLRAARQRRG